MGCSVVAVQGRGGSKIQEGDTLAFAAATLESLSIGDQTPTGEADAAPAKPSWTLPGSLTSWGTAGVRTRAIWLRIARLYPRSRWLHR